MFGEKCKRIHDVNEYMKIKPKDLGNLCLSFRRHGICPYSFTCRFGSDHITHTEENGKFLDCAFQNSDCGIKHRTDCPDLLGNYQFKHFA